MLEEQKFTGQTTYQSKGDDVATCLIGLQWGDEGKGKISHFLSDNYDVSCRFQGGGNAGHTIWHNGEKIVTHMLPVGIVNPEIVCILGNGMVINPTALVEEIHQVASLLGETAGSLSSRIFISNKAHLVTEEALEMDEYRERTQMLGTTKTGIGPTYESKANRTGVTAGMAAQDVLARFPVFAATFRGRIVNTEVMINRLHGEGKRIFFEGAQGVLLDVDMGQYPYVTSSNCTAHAVGTGAGFSFGKLDRVIGVSKPYSTRVGAGPFTSAMTEEDDEAVRTLGGEFGATTGRPRKCGWLDVMALKYAVEIGGVTEIALTKMDILDNLDAIPVCVGYTIGASEITDTLEFPYGEQWNVCEPIWEKWPGWKDGGSYCEFIAKLEEFVGVPVSIVSFGPDRESTTEINIDERV